MFCTLIKIKLNNHSDWDKWLMGILEVTQDHALVHIPPPVDIRVQTFVLRTQDSSTTLDPSMIVDSNDNGQHDEGGIEGLEDGKDKAG